MWNENSLLKGTTKTQLIIRLPWKSLHIVQIKIFPNIEHSKEIKW